MLVSFVFENLNYVLWQSYPRTPNRALHTNYK